MILWLSSFISFVRTSERHFVAFVVAVAQENIIFGKIVVKQVIAMTATSNTHSQLDNQIGFVSRYLYRASDIGPSRRWEGGKGSGLGWDSEHLICCEYIRNKLSLNCFIIVLKLDIHRINRVWHVLRWHRTTIERRDAEETSRATTEKNGNAMCASGTASYTTYTSGMGQNAMPHRKQQTTIINN